MENLTLGAVETRFAEIIWAHAPLSSRELAEICQKELDWKRPTTYNVLRKLCEKGLFENRGGTVCPLVSREAFKAMRGEQFLADNYGGSLPAFIAAFTARKPLTSAEVEEIQRMIDAAKGEVS